MKNILFIFFYLIFFKANGQCIQLHGKIINYIDNKGLSAEISTKTGAKKQILGQSDETGMFKVNIPCGTPSITLTKKGFRSVEVPLTNADYNGLYYVTFQMLALDKEIMDKPYAQSEQSDFTLANAKEPKVDKKAIRYFKVIDAITKKAIKSKVCLYYTKNGQEQCFETKETSAEKVVFTEEDIIAIEIEAKGFQKYMGNLVIDKIDNKVSNYEIALSKTPVYISVDVHTVNPDMLQKVTISDTKPKNIPTFIKQNSFYANVEEAGVYKYSITTTKQTLNGQFTVNSGLSFFKIEEPTQQPKKDSVANVSANLKRNDTDIIYFEQSDYNLTAGAKGTLDSIARYLAVKTDIYAKIIGHTDNVGDPKKNETLGEYRAKITYTYLLKSGINPKRLSWISYGGNRPANSNDDENNKKKNRRVEIIYTKQELTDTK
ncbi:OmpA family protein [Emticicia sp. 17c]|uniref:OmpA family protein n=1 Tax=Emticicia sp. 17c TaxID=3127704 RepID=UPI00301BC575